MINSGAHRYGGKETGFWQLAGLLLIALLLSNRHYHGIVQGRPQAVERSCAVLLSPLYRAVEGSARLLRSLAQAADGHMAARIAALRSRTEELERSGSALEARSTAASPFPGLVTQQTILREAMAHRQTARVLGEDPTNWARGLLLDRGAHQGIEAGDPVVVGPDLVAVVTRTYRSLSVARWITDGHMRVDLRNARTGEALGEAVGPSPSGRDAVRLECRRKPADIREGDLFITSGLQGSIPGGLRVGRASRCEVAQPDGTVVIWIRPLHPSETLDRVAILPMSRTRAGVSQDSSAQADVGRWTSDGGRWTVDVGRWTLDVGRWTEASWRVAWASS